LITQRTHTAKIIFVNNVVRKDVGMIDYTFSSTGKDLILDIEQVLDHAGHPFNTEKGKIYLKREDKLILLDKNTVFNSENLSIIYSEVISIQNAVRYDEIDGVVLFFKTEEHTHLYFPHIHARYAGEEISISLIDYQVIGHFKTHKKVKSAVEYVQKNIDGLYREWERIQNSQLSVSPM